MAIINKKKYFNKIYFSIFEKTMTKVNELNSIMTYFGAKQAIKENPDRFVVASYFHCLYFLEGILQKNYYSEYPNEVEMIRDAMILELSNRLKMDQGALTDVYLFICNSLEGICTNEKLKDINPLAYAATFYLAFTFEKQYDPEQHGFSLEEVLITLEKVFGDFIVANENI